MMDIPSTHTGIIVVAAGSGHRFGGDVPKQFRLLAGRPMLMHTIDAFRTALPDASIVVALSPDMKAYWASLCSEYKFASPPVAEGGGTRCESVYKALSALPSDINIILVHDGGRPIVSPELIHRVVAAATVSKAAVPAIPVTDSMRRADTGKAVDRSIFRAVQTPQGFDAHILRNAYSAINCADPMLTDDASVVERSGVQVTMVDGDAHNIKVTLPGDIALAETLLKLTGIQ
ncbi:MAG: 2-C-methyl-D-erythritol 4-phosphate cytidylyltransferase [Bacteroidales bacterium]|nr:2-C-methyl-D-erythritol 4-phosphate cytidylyltransferase [Bacteroidales bacterium]